MNIIGQTLNAPYIEENHPVFSSRAFPKFHFTLVKSGGAWLNGLQAVCPNGCNAQISCGSKSAKVDGRPARKYRFVCSKCNFVSTSKIAEDQTIPKDYQDLVMKVPGVNYLRTQFPIPTMPLSWRNKGPSPIIEEEGPSVQAPSTSTPSSIPPSPPLTTASLLESEVEDTQEPPNLTPQQSEALANNVRMGLALEAVTFSVLGHRQGSGSRKEASAKRVRKDSGVPRQDPGVEEGSSSSASRKKPKAGKCFSSSSMDI
jgi:hypothetical protein